MASGPGQISSQRSYFSDFLRSVGFQPIDVSEDLPELALGLGLGPTDNHSLREALARGVSVEIKGYLLGSRATLADTAFHVVSTSIQ